MQSAVCRSALRPSSPPALYSALRSLGTSPNLRITAVISRPAKGDRAAVRAHCRDARHGFRKPHVDRLPENDGRQRLLVSLPRPSKLSRTRWSLHRRCLAAASTAFPVGPSSAPLPALERVGQRVRGLPGIKRLQRIDDVVIPTTFPVAVARSAGLDSSEHASEAHTQAPTAFRQPSCRYPAQRPGGGGRPSTDEARHQCRAASSWLESSAP